MSTQAQACVRKESAVTHKPLLLVRAMLLLHFDGDEQLASQQFWRVHDFEVCYAEIPVGVNGWMRDVNGHVRIGLADLRLVGTISIRNTGLAGVWQVMCAEYTSTASPLLDKNSKPIPLSYTLKEDDPIFFRV